MTLSNMKWAGLLALAVGMIGTRAAPARVPAARTQAG